MNPHLLVIELNNQAVAFMKQNQFHDAISATSAALKYQREIEIARSVAQCSTSEGEEECACDCIDQYMLECDRVDLPCSALSSEFVYQQGIPIPYNATKTMAQVTPIIIFNSALSHQLLALHQQHHQAGTIKSQHFLTHAKRLYQLAHDANDREENVLFQFAVINNTAVIHKALGNLAASKKCFDFLLSLLMVFIDRGCSTQVKHMHDFLVNVSANAGTAAAA
ncbi:unnamed protein product [Cylindrotheca closterium]|uniref:Uncharacterized protein n=1 Tax=Cylindrotheca closterium TaxID=2856 RepID=A0AAD2JH97_9STRA|nr:unnamed protein product [Cylindrotheca closterium]